MAVKGVVASERLLEQHVVLLIVRGRHRRRLRIPALAALAAPLDAAASLPRHDRRLPLGVLRPRARARVVDLHLPRRRGAAPLLRRLAGAPLGPQPRRCGEGERHHGLHLLPQHPPLLRLEAYVLPHVGVRLGGHHPPRDQERIAGIPEHLAKEPGENLLSRRLGLVAGTVPYSLELRESRQKPGMYRALRLGDSVPRARVLALVGAVVLI
mmetsp:Transcript_13414/g.38602  ORF Transcript_13414/g.38602 Transcript_13414/m.38602 type:complete len:211 (-) Transcript_13414:309-941(-)